jgi:hypothetical protein
MRHRYLAGLIGGATVLALLSGSTLQVARAHTTSGLVNSFHCLAAHAGETTTEAGSMVTIGLGWRTQTLGDQNTFLDVETTIVSVNDESMFDVSDQWSAPVNAGGAWASSLEIPTGVTLAQGEEMRFTFALLFSRQIAEQFNPAAGGEPGPIVHSAGLVFGGTCTVTGV